MKYKKIYEVLEQRRSSSPDFRYSDYSGWRSYYRSYMDRQRPLWIVAEDPSAGRRLWITQERSQLSITVGPMDHERRNHGHAHTISCRNQADMCATLYNLFESAAGAA